MASESHISIPLETLLAILRAEGFGDISTTAILDIQKIVANLDEEEIKDYRKLKYFLSPVICRNKEDQEKFSQVFDQFVEEIEKETKKQNRIIKPPRLKFVLRIAIAFSVIVFIAGVIWWLIPPTPPKPYLSLSQTTYWPTGKFVGTAIGDSILYKAYLHDTIPGKKYIIEWQLAKKTYNNSRYIQKTYSDTGYYTANVFVKNEKGNIIITDSVVTAVLFEHPPSVSIQTNDEDDRKIYTALPNDPTEKVKRYRYKWYINDSLASEKEKFPTNYHSNKPYDVKVVIDSRGLYHSKKFDSLSASVHEMPYSLKAAGLSPAKSSSVFLGGNLIWILFSLLLIPVSAALLIFRLWKKPKPIPDEQKVKPEDILPAEENKKESERTEGPFFIEFKKQDHKISPEEQISRLADGLRKRQLSDVYKLHLKKTIGKTIHAGGFPSFEFVPATQPMDFLALIDKEYPEGHLVKLFEYLLGRLQSQEVNIIVYDYYKEPLYLNNQKFNHIHIPLDRVAQLYSGSVLFLFTTGEYFFEPLKTKLKPWVEEKFKLWKNKIIITPTPRKDWAYKESILQQNGFAIISADLYQNNLLKILLDLISQQAEMTKNEKIEIPQTYSARYFNFQEFDALAKYLNDPELIKWVSATAVYPNVDWKVTLAIGKALEEEAKLKKEDKCLVSYENLLKISRISWMQDGIIDDTLRLEMLRNIDDTTEAVARKAIVGLLEEIKEQFTEKSFAKEELDLHHNSNLLLLHAHDKGNPVSEETAAAVRQYFLKGYLDWPQSVYYEEARSTLMKGETASVSPEVYFRKFDKDNEDRKKKEEEIREKAEEELKRKEKRRKLLRNFTTAGSLLILSFIGGRLLNQNGLFQLWKISPAGLKIILRQTVQLKQIGDFNLTIKVDTSTFVSQKKNDSLFVFNNLPVYTKGQRLTLFLEPLEGSQSYTDISPDSSYLVSLAEPGPRPLLSIRYNNRLRKADLISLMGVLYGNFEIDTSYLNFADSSHIDYYNISQQPQATLIATVVNQALGKNISIKSDYRTSNDNPVLFLNLSGNLPACQPLLARNLPATLEDVWLFNTNIISFDLNGKVLYLSDNQSGQTYNSLYIQEICRDNNNVYRIKTKTTIGALTPFGIKNISSAGFNLAICQFAGDMNPRSFSNEADGQHVQQVSCNNFTRIRPYYEKDPQKIFLPANPRQSMDDNERKKIRLLAGSSKFNIIFYQNDFSGIRKDYTDLIKNTLKTFGLAESVNNITYKNFSGTPFQRNYFSIENTQAETKSDQNTPPSDPVPDCKRVFYSLEDALSADPRVICNLDLTKENRATIPDEISRFINLKELILGETSIPEASIKQLQDKLPKCNIKYTVKVKPPEINNTNKETDLGVIQVDKKGYPMDSSLALIRTLAFRLKANSALSIRLEASYINKAQQKDITDYIRTIKNLFYKEGVIEKQQQIEEQVTAVQNQQQQKNISNRTISNYTTIRVIGINFPGKAGSKTE